MSPLRRFNETTKVMTNALAPRQYVSYTFGRTSSRDHSVWKNERHLFPDWWADRPTSQPVSRLAGGLLLAFGPLTACWGKPAHQLRTCNMVVQSGDAPLVSSASRSASRLVWRTDVACWLADWVDRLASDVSLTSRAGSSDR